MGLIKESVRGFGEFDIRLIIGLMCLMQDLMVGFICLLKDSIKVFRV